jgi:5-methylthioadenosine/S-adenosylhomocysteine deaminase
MVEVSVFDVTVVTMDRDRRIIEDGAVVIKGDRILDVGKSNEIRSKYGEEGTLIDGSGMVAIPGLVNAHTHTYEALLKGLGDDTGPLRNWVKTLLEPIDPFLDDEVLYISALLSHLEMIRSGTTFVIDHHCHITGEGVADKIVQSIRETGIKGLIARGMKVRGSRLARMRPTTEYPSLDEEVRLTERLIRKWHRKVEDRVLICPAPIITGYAGSDLLIEAKRLSDKYKVPIHAHTSEVPDEVKAALEDYGKTEVELLYDLGALSPRFHVVHGVWLDGKDIKMMGETGANLIHCPVSNMYLASGVAPVTQLLTAGVNVALGSDASCNENNDMIRVMKTAILLHKVHTLNPKVTPAGQALEMATLGGARALGLEDEIGSIEPGKRADLVLVNLQTPHTTPAHRVVPSLVYNACGVDVDTVIIDGKVVVEGGEVKTVDEEAVIEKAQEIADSLVERAGITHLKKRSQFL